MKIVSTFSQHLKTPDKSFRSLPKRKQLDLARDIQGGEKKSTWIPSSGSYFATHNLGGTWEANSWFA